MSGLSIVHCTLNLTVILYIVLEWLLASLFVDSLQPDNGAVARCIVPDRKYARKKFHQRRNTLEPLCEDKKRAQVSTLLTDLGLLHYGYAVCDHSLVFLE